NRPRGRFRMKLHAHKGAYAVSDTLVSAIIGVDKPRFPVRRQGGVVHRIAVVLRGDVAAPRPYFQTGLILAPVPEFDLIGVTTGCQGQELMAEADAKKGHIQVHSVPDVCNRRSALGRITRTIGDEHTVTLFLHKVIIPRHPEDGNVACQEAADDTLLAAAVDD